MRNPNYETPAYVILFYPLLLHPFYSKYLLQHYRWSTHNIQTSSLLFCTHYCLGHCLCTSVNAQTVQEWLKAQLETCYRQGLNKLANSWAQYIEMHRNRIRLTSCDYSVKTDTDIYLSSYISICTTRFFAFHWNESLSQFKAPWNCTMLYES